MSKKYAQVIIASLSILLAVAIGIIAFCALKPAVEPVENTENPALTLDDLRGTAVNTDGWKTYGSENGDLEFNHPDGLEFLGEYERTNPETNETDVNGPGVAQLNALYALEFSGNYLPSDLKQKIDEASATYNDEAQLYVFLFDSSISDATINLINREERGFAKDYKKTIDGQEFTVIDDYHWTDNSLRVVKYIAELPSGDTLYVEYRVKDQTINNPLWKVELADSIFEEIIGSIKTN